MNKTYQLSIAVILMMLASAVISHTRLVLAQEASPTSTASFTATPSATTPSPTNTHSSTNTFTPTPLPSQTPTPISTNTQIPLPTPYTVDDIHSRFTSDFEKIDTQLSKIYDQVYAPPGASIIENVFSNFLYDLVKPSSETNNIIYLLAKIIGSVSLIIKISIVFVKNKDKGGVRLVNAIVTTIIFLYALIFLGILFRPQVLPYQTQTTNERDIALSNIENQLSVITNYINESPPQSATEGQTAINGTELGNVESQLVSISNQLQAISTQDQESVATLNTRLEEIKVLVEGTKDSSAKRGLQWVNFFLLVALLILSVLRGDVENLFRRFGS